MTVPRRAGRRTNLALLAVLPVAFATGWLAFATGTPWPARVVTALHAGAGIAVPLLVPWKQLIVRRGLTRSPRRVATKVASVALALLVLLSITAGLTHSSFGPQQWLGLSTMQVHVGAAVAAVPLFVAHVLTRRPYLRRTDLSRRNALRLGALAGAAAVGFGLVELAAAVAGLPGRSRRATGSFEVAAGAPVPQVAWLFDEVPDLDPAGYAVAVNGRRVAYADLAAGTDEVRAVLDCTSGWWAARTWRGVRLDALLGGVPPRGSVVVTSATGYRRRFPAAEASSLWLATHVGGVPIDAGHGAPARLVAPGRRGFWWVKWVATIDVEDTPDWWQGPFPLS